MSSDAYFQHIATFYSLIVGLAVANVFSAIANSAKTTARVRWYWMYTASAGMLLLLIAQDWWFLLSWDGPVKVSHAILVFLLARAGVLYFASNLLIPDHQDAEDGILDLRVHMLHVRRRFFAALAFFPILDLIDTRLKGRERLVDLGPFYLTYVGVFFGLMLCASLVQRERIANIIVVTMLAVLIWMIVGGALDLL
jgi:hypothetical protein